MSKHTPGPLIADGYNVRQPNGRHCAYTGPHHTPPNEYPAQCRLEDEANAVLYAAAPDLLAACKLAEDALMRSTPDLKCDWIAHQEALVAVVNAKNKAEGRA